MYAFSEQSIFCLFPPGVILPEHTPDAYIFAYADGYTLNFLLAAAFPFAQSLAIMHLQIF